MNFTHILQIAFLFLEYEHKTVWPYKNLVAEFLNHISSDYIYQMQFILFSPFYFIKILVHKQMDKEREPSFILMLTTQGGPN